MNEDEGRGEAGSSILGDKDLGDEPGEPAIRRASRKGGRNLRSLSGRLFAVVAGFAVGAAAMWGLVLVGSVSPRLPSESLPIIVPADPLPFPPGWDTEFSDRLDIKLVGQYDDSGPAAWDAAAHPLVYITTNGPGYGGFMSGTNSPGIVIIDANTYEVVAEKQYLLEGVNSTKYWEDHGLGVSADGKWIYLPTGDTSKPISQAGRFLIINAKTLKVHQVLQTSSYPHHVKVLEHYNGTAVKRLVLSYTFNWQIPGGAMRPGSGVFVLDPDDNHRVVGGFRSEDVQANPYLAFPHPDGRHLFVGLPPGPITDSDIQHDLEGMVAVIDMNTWLPIDYYKAGYDPIWTAFTADGKYAYVGDGGSDEIFKIDNVAQKVVGVSRSAVHGGYGLVMSWDETKIFVVEKGEASHNRGHLIGEVNATRMAPIASYETHCLRGDHAILHPDRVRNEFWVSYNSNFRDVVFDMGRNEVKATITHSGSSHNGAFVRYAVDANGEWTGEVLSDQSGLHGSARALKEDLLGVTEIVYGSLRVPVSVFRGGP